MQRIVLWGFAFFVALGASLGAFLFVSLWPYFSIIGRVAAGVVIIGLGCASALLISFTYNRIITWSAKRRNAVLLSRVVAIGDVVGYANADGSWVHLSAMHEQAKLPPPAAAPVIVDQNDPSATDETILELWDKGLSLRTIEKATGRKYHEIQKITSEEKKKRGGKA